MKTALVTGASGFVGYFTARALLDTGWRVIGIDSMSDYYDVTLKERRQAMLLDHPAYQVVNDKIETPGTLLTLFEQHRPDIVIHLAAQAGVRHSIQMPRAYVEANLIGTFELLEAARTFPPKHLLLASSSSVYGANTKLPYAEGDKVDTQMSFYAATKKATENLAHSYAHLYKLPTTMYRFFTVYGPWGRPDMAHFKFTRAILNGDPIDIYNHGDMKRDFTYVDDLVASLLALADKVPDPEHPVAGDSISPVAPFRVVNIGNDSPVNLLDFIKAIETACGREAIKTYHPMQPGDVPATWADATLLKTLTGQRPVTPIATGIQHFVDWYRAYYNV
ncbi:Udp-glucuronic acid epimerase protein [Sulfitobacter noctilucicola]|uniref:UDP-glucuronate 4-epimerase n=1 Tax=Sulfitobacter noctilucicola TaxID=1342301 RepID=A0A7W6Q597_9RHOB|nr:NAD-dependent epimerase/dehydratase family protein [Sulfitobacter noctilucicola]KIN63444.1 Udp-glucuronic acid epimerase protein [Sulfitobacter noctilucicola]MBB4175044.1 UDP-glucuronate 4-epimerase [Sulfitobacter noctilucicola]